MQKLAKTSAGANPPESLKVLANHGSESGQNVCGVVHVLVLVSLLLLLFVDFISGFSAQSKIFQIYCCIVVFQSNVCAFSAAVLLRTLRSTGALIPVGALPSFHFLCTVRLDVLWTTA